LYNIKGKRERLTKGGVKRRRGLHETRYGDETAVANAEVYPNISEPPSNAY